MKYALYRAMRNTLHNIRQYIFVLFQIIVGIALLFISLSIEGSFGQEIEFYKSTLAQNLVTVSGYSDSKGLDITPKDFRYISDHLKPLSTQLAYSIDFAIYIRAGIEEKRVPVYFVSDDYYLLLMNWDNSQSNAFYAGDWIVEALQESGVDSLNNPAIFNVQKKLLFDYPLLSYAQLDKNIVMKQTARSVLIEGVSDESSSFQNSIFLPLNQYFAYEQEVFGTSYLFVPIDTNNLENTDSFCIDILKYLKSQHPKNDYQYTKDFSFLLDRTNSLTQSTELFNIISSIILVIVLFSLTGLLMLIIHRRRYAIATSMMCGASDYQISFELMAEVFFVVLTGTLFGILVGFLLLPSLHVEGFEIHYTYIAIFSCLGIGTAITVIGSLFMMIRARKITPLEFGSLS